jgi:phage tail sheath protein FI
MLNKLKRAALGAPYDNGYLGFTINQGSVPFVAGDSFTFNLIQVLLNDPLGANDAAKRLAIKTALQAEINSNTEVRSEMYEYNIIVCPGYPEVVDELLALSVAVNDEAFVIADTPGNKSPDEVANWANTSERFNSTSVAYYYPWGLASNLDGNDVFCAPSGIALRTFAYSDSVSELWFAPAGVRRGLVTGVSKVGYITGAVGTPTTFVESNLNQGQRDNLYEFYKNINPIVYFPGRGIIIWGQKTAASAASALDRINVVRLVMYMKRGLRKGAFPFVFEPNDQITRDNLKAAADGFLGDIMIKRGLYDFVTLCDESNNTATRIDRNELWLDVAIKPVKAAEFIYIPIRVLNTGATMPG